MTAGFNDYSPGFNSDGIATLSVTSVSSNVALGSSGLNRGAIITNTGTGTAYVALGGSTITATTSGFVVLPGATIFLGLNTNANTYLAAITATGTATLSITTGLGTPELVGAAPLSVSVTSTLPAGASTAALQSNVQSAPGTPQTEAITVQGNASGVPVPVSGTLSYTPATTNKVTGTASTTSGTSTSLVGAVASQRLYITNYAVSNTSATTIVVSFQDGSGGTTLWTQIVPAGGGANISGTEPLFWTTAGNALFFSSSTGETTILANASGFSGT